ncbi:hypothetical protein HG535_0B03980 [Zygotorulaspora mrakii]|uniref:Protein CWH43 n=1 Tax=Zygotorulaspora mrakii TaxID=42260 RepID=A0A7H9AY63_ZYGMR|nr:uncharacterized protein HG535_0B03980 [Zygotorulaspora mrakii]QLG71358.1 hypothetical protein HG535_0B03980 [Zygotorulaspora mrakii]
MVALSGKIIPLAHTICASAAFLAALAAGYKLHFHKIVRNAHYGYPDEWFPSVSATIGDRYPERSIFQILIALTSFPRFLLLLGHLYLNGSIACFVIGVIRTVTCGGWVYITSTDDHDIHDIFMISYIVLTLPWDIMITRKTTQAKLAKGITASAFFATLVPLLYWYYQHQVKHIAGAYSVYAYFEWSLIGLDIAFDALSYSDFENLIVDLSYEISDNGTTFFKFDKLKSPKPQSISQGDTSLSCDEQEYVEDSEAEITADTTIADVIRSNDEEIEIVFEKTEKITVLPDMSRAPSYDSFLYILTNTFNSFMFWTAMTSLTCSIWYFPLWYMGISGYEAAMLFFLGPIVLYIPFMPTVIYQYGVLLSGIIGIGSHFIGSPETRLIVQGVGTAITVATFVLNLKSLLNRQINGSFTITWVFGLVLSVAIKMGCYSNNPLWPIMNAENGGYNKTGLVLVTFFGLLSPYVNSVHFMEAEDIEAEVTASEKKVSFLTRLFLSLGFGSLIFSIHQLLTDASTVIYWSWEGWGENSQGPLSWPWSGLTCTVMLLAGISSLRFSNFSLFPAFLLSVSTAILCIRDITQWTKYIFGGLLYATSIIWLLPSYFVALPLTGSLAVFVWGCLLYIILVLAHVWVVAYAFVPGGWLLRERIEYVLAFSSFCIVLGALSIQFSGPFTKLRNFDRDLSPKFYKIVSYFAFTIISLIGFFTYNLRPTGIPQPYHPDSKLITAGIWTIHFGLDNDMWASEDGMQFLIKEMELDVVGLLETDTQRITMGNRDFSSKLGHDLNMYSDFGPGPNKHTWGCMLLSKFPIINSTHHLLPSPNGELAPAIYATLKTYDDILVDVFVFHGGQEEDDEDRRLQSEKLAELMGNTDRPAILLSYLVTHPHRGYYNNFVSEASGMHDIDPADDDRWCEYILYKKLKRTGYARVTRGTITDTEMQIGKFQVLTEEQVTQYGDSLYEFNKSDYTPNGDLEFPNKFNDEGERGHRYHVFDKPLYYEVPDGSVKK